MSNKRTIFDYSNTNYGNNALDSTLPTANNNCAFGTNSLTNNTSGDDNTGFGFQSLSSVITGARNTVIGSGSGSSIVSGNGNILIGYNSGSTLPSNKSNNLTIANSATSNLVCGDFSQQRIGFCYGSSSSALSGDVSIDGQQDRVLTVERHLISTGKNLTIVAGGGASSSSNSGGGDLILQSGMTTGTGSSKIVFSVIDNTAVSSATTDNTYTDRIIIAPPKKLSLTKNAAVQNPLFIINIPSGKVASGTFDLGLSIYTSTDIQSYQDQYVYSISNKNGTISSNFSNFGAVTTQTSGLLVVTMNFINGTNQVIIRPTINVGIPAGSLVNSYAYLTIRNNSSSSITLYT